jgi:Mg2+/citrate symporter
MDDDRHGRDSTSSWLSLKRIGLTAGMGLAAALAVVVASRIGSEALSIVVGVICGVAAGIPTSLLLLMVMSRRERQRYARSRRQNEAGNYPPVVVIQGGVPQVLRSRQPADRWPSSAGPTAQHRLHVVGGEELVDEGLY